MTRCQRRALTVRALMALLLGAAVATATPARGQTSVTVPAPGGQVTVIADRIEQVGRDNLMVATGNVEIARGTVRLLADRAELNRDTGDVVASGRVIFYDGDDQLAGERLEYNYKTGTGVATNGQARTAPYYRIGGERMERLGEGLYGIRRGFFTTCEDDPPTWAFHSADATADLNDSVYGTHASFWVKELPVIPWLPGFYTAIRRERQTGFLFPVVGDSSFKGFFAQVPFFWAISDSQDALITPGVMSERGLAVDGTYRYIFSPDNRGAATGVMVWEGLVEGAVRGSYGVKHTWDLTDRLRFTADINGVSDDAFLGDYARALQTRGAQYVPSNVFLTQRWSTFNLTANAFWYEDLTQTRPVSLQRFPQLFFDAAPQPIPGLPGFLYQFQVSAVNFVRDVGSEGGRLAVLPMVSRPIRIADAVTVTPFAGAIVTAYTKTATGAQTTTGSRLVVDTRTASGFRTESQNIVLEETTSDPLIRPLAVVGAEVTAPALAGLPRGLRRNRRVSPRHRTARELFVHRRPRHRGRPPVDGTGSHPHGQPGELFGDQPLVRAVDGAAGHGGGQAGGGTTHRQPVLRRPEHHDALHPRLRGAHFQPEPDHLLPRRRHLRHRLRRWAAVIHRRRAGGATLFFRVPRDHLQQARQRELRAGRGHRRHHALRHRARPDQLGPAVGEVRGEPLRGGPQISVLGRVLRVRLALPERQRVSLHPEPPGRRGLRLGCRVLLMRPLADPARASVRFPGLRAVVVSLRPRQWVKNLFVFAGLVFSQQLFSPAAWTALAAFAVFCALSGAIYLLNDVADRERDRLHPLKRARPIAAGDLPAGAAVTIAGALLAVGLGAAWLIAAPFVLAALAYVALLGAYSAWLKHIVIADVLAVALGFVLRAVAGALAIGVAISGWLVICTLQIALFLAIGKRRHEYRSLGEAAARHRPILAEYSAGLLDQMIAVVTASAVTAYSLYTMSPETVAKFHTPLLPATLPFVIYGIFRYLYLLYRRELGGNPSELFLNDGPLLLNSVCWVLAVVVIIYWTSLGWGGPHRWPPQAALRRSARRRPRGLARECSSISREA